jgi:hypothetical protein
MRATGAAAATRRARAAAAITIGEGRRRRCRSSSSASTRRAHVMTRLLTFDTTHHALLAEQVAHEHGLGAESTPAPPEAGAKCDLALEYLPEEETRCSPLLARAGRSGFRIWRTAR